MFGYIGAARLKRRLTPSLVSLAACGLMCFGLAYLPRHVSYLQPLRPYQFAFLLAGSVLLVFEMWSIRRRDEQLLLISQTEI